ncbi:TPA: hydrolase, partial [Enterobacter ludwigii]|nr:hydrolase [Enterobacter ludwigii]
MLTLNARKTALVVIDLQEGILPFAGGPHSAEDVVSRAARLAEKCRASGAPVIMVRVGWSADFAEALKQPVDAQVAAHSLPENWWTYPVSLGKRDSDIEVTKRQWGAFYGTDLELQLRRRGI